IRALREWRKSWPLPSAPTPQAAPVFNSSLGESGPQIALDSLTRSSILSSIPNFGDNFDPSQSGEFSSTDMVSRLEPKSFRWLESSPAEQEFLGWNLRQLREKSFLEIVHPDDYPRAKEQLRAALVRGELHGLIVRIKTAREKPKAIEMNVGVRYGPDLKITHLRCHITDVTIKVRAERELRLRTRELTQVNEQLRQINRELEELKERYRDLYQNSPAMYFSLDDHGRFIECNDTLLRTLGYRREDLIGRSYERILPESRRSLFASRFADFVRTGSTETASQWIKPSGELIDVWVSGTTVLGHDGRFLRSRNVTQDVTARNRLEAELHEKNDRLARTNEELSSKNKEMDEFAYVVSHDLQEPLRTLIAFSDFLLRDCGDQLDANGQEYVRYLVEAARRMRSLIHGLLNLSRAGRVTGDLSAVNLDDVVEVVKADLAELIRTKGAEIRVPAPLPMIWGDRDRLGQLLANLIGNGLKYNTEPAPWVEIGALSVDPGPQVTIYVKDNGIGIDPQFHAKIFQLFRRLHTREEYEGTGAGLAICTKIVQAHGGRIWVESEPGQGSTFFISLSRPPSTESRTEAPHAS
ncbi:sensor histidine kinase, partial [Singulisphaera rosea]